jgi:hypothetical protein
MPIDDDHRHCGSALIQLAEDRYFTALNAAEADGGHLVGFVVSSPFLRASKRVSQHRILK